MPSGPGPPEQHRGVPSSEQLPDPAGELRRAWRRLIELAVERVEKLPDCLGVARPADANRELGRLAHPRP
jgi:hypothetical protein